MKAGRGGKRRKPDEVEQGDASLPLAKKAKPPVANDPNQPAGQSNTDQEVAKAAKKASTSKGLSTQKPQVEKHIRQAASSVLASINPSVPMSLQEKREKLAEIKKVGMSTQTVQASPEEERFLLRVFQTTLKEWATGYEEGLLLLNQPPTIEKPSIDDPTKLERKFGPVPKLDPDFLLPALAGYSAAKMHTGQIMTTWDHHFRAWMQVNPCPSAVSSLDPRSPHLLPEKTKTDKQ